MVQCSPGVPVFGGNNSHCGSVQSGPCFIGTATIGFQCGSAESYNLRIAFEMKTAYTTGSVLNDSRGDFEILASDVVHRSPKNVKRGPESQRFWVLTSNVLRDILPLDSPVSITLGSTVVRDFNSHSEFLTFVLECDSDEVRHVNHVFPRHELCFCTFVFIYYDFIHDT